jgi:hypothetical protein
MSKRLIAVATASLLPLAVHAADMPKSGTDSFTNTWMTTSSKIMKVGDRTLTTYEISGVHRNDNRDAMITDMGMRCLGLFDGASPPQEHGGCTYTDKDGDAIMTTFDRKSETSGVETLAAGTGKFAGISGTVEYTVIDFPVKADDNINRGVVAEKWQWKLP